MTVTSAFKRQDPAQEVRLERLEAQIVELASQLTAAGARLTRLIGQFDAAEGWRRWGMRSTAHWLSWKCGMGLGAAREQVRVARALRDLPATCPIQRCGLSRASLRPRLRLNLSTWRSPRRQLRSKPSSQETVEQCEPMTHESAVSRSSCGATSTSTGQLSARSDSARNAG